MRSHFLQESWNRKAEEERAESAEEPGVRLFHSFENIAREYPALTEAVAEVKKAIGNYANAVAAHSYTNAQKLSKAEIETANQHRYVVHERLIDTVNRLSRDYRKAGLDNKWRNAIIGDSREQLGEWALAIARQALNRQ
jgi:murein endopeptidase